MQEYPFSED